MNPKETQIYPPENEETPKTYFYDASDDGEAEPPISPLVLLQLLLRQNGEGYED